MILATTGYIEKELLIILPSFAVHTFNTTNVATLHTEMIYNSLRQISYIKTRKTLGLLKAGLGNEC